MSDATWEWKDETPFGVTGWYAPHALGGDMYRFIFPNGFAGSVVRFSASIGYGFDHTVGSYGHSFGLWELAVLSHRDGDVGDPNSYSITYGTEITDDVIGHLDEDSVASLLNEIKKLEPV